MLRWGDAHGPPEAPGDDLVLWHALGKAGESKPGWHWPRVPRAGIQPCFCTKTSRALPDVSLGFCTNTHVFFHPLCLQTLLFNLAEKELFKKLTSMPLVIAQLQAHKYSFSILFDVDAFRAGCCQLDQVECPWPDLSTLRGHAAPVKVLGPGCWSDPGLLDPVEAAGCPRGCKALPQVPEVSPCCSCTHGGMEMRGSCGDNTVASGFCWGLEEPLSARMLPWNVVSLC